MKTAKQVVFSTALVALIGLSGCASTGEISALKSDIAAAQAAADSAAATAAAAKAEAAEAKALAAEAKAQSAATEEKIDRMFKKAMYK